MSLWLASLSRCFEFPCYNDEGEGYDTYRDEDELEEEMKMTMPCLF